MKVLYVTTPGAPEATTVLHDLLRLEPYLEIQAVAGAAAALAEVRTAGGYDVIFISPSVPHTDAHALIATRRRDHTPIPVIAIPQAPPESGEAGQATDLVDQLREAAAALAVLRAENGRLQEIQAFERAMRDRDREALAALTREIAEERERRAVLDATLRHTEEQTRAELAALTAVHEDECRLLEENVAKAADRLHQVAHETQALQTRLEHQLEDRIAERDRLLDNALIGHAVFARDGRLVRCSQTFASMLGYETALDALEANGLHPFDGAPDHERIVALLDQGVAVDRVESTLRNSDGRPVRVLTSALALPVSSRTGDNEQIERLFVDLTNQATLEVELRLARRLETAGRLAAEMAPDIETSLARGSERTTLLVKQLIAFSRRQAKPAGFLSLNDAIVRSQGLLRQIAGDGTDLQFELGVVEPVTAGEEEIEQLLIEFVGSAAGSLPYGGRLTVTTASVTSPESEDTGRNHSQFVLRTSLTATAAGFGVLSVNPSSSLARLVARCGGVVRTSGDAGRTSILHVSLPC